MRISPVIAAVALLVACGPGPTVFGEQGWGHLTGRVVLRGTPPQLAQLDPGTDQVCCQANPKNESLVLGDEQAIANVVVFLRPPRGSQVPVHPDYDRQRQQPASLDNQGCAFRPRVTLVRTGQPLLLKNSDATNHNIKGELGSEAFNFMLPAGGEQQLTFEVHQRLPRPVSCNIHPFMSGWLLVRDDPYMAVTDESGRFTLAQLPAGDHEFQFWHEMTGYLKNCRSEQFELDRRGRLTVSVPADGEVDLGTIYVDAESLTE